MNLDQLLTTLCRLFQRCPCRNQIGLRQQLGLQQAANPRLPHVIHNATLIVYLVVFQWLNDREKRALRLGRLRNEILSQLIHVLFGDVFIEALPQLLS